MNITRIRIVSDAIYIEWEDDNLGFGCVDFYEQKDGSILIDSENMSRSFVKSVFEKIIDDAKFEFE